MSYHSDEIRGILVQIGEERLLLPNATIAEVLATVPVQPIEGTPSWLIGELDWQGWKVPLISFAALSGLPDSKSGHDKIVVLKALGGNKRLPYFALQTGLFPQLISVPRDGLLADAAEGDVPPMVRVRVLLGGDSILLPDLDMLEEHLNAALNAVNWSSLAHMTVPE